MTNWLDNILLTSFVAGWRLNEGHCQVSSDTPAPCFDSLWSLAPTCIWHHRVDAFTITCFPCFTAGPHSFSCCVLHYHCVFYKSWQSTEGSVRCIGYVLSDVAKDFFFFFFFLVIKRTKFYQSFWKHSVYGWMTDTTWSLCGRVIIYVYSSDTLKQ